MRPIYYVLLLLMLAGCNKNEVGDGITNYLD